MVVGAARVLFVDHTAELGGGEIALLTMVDGFSDGIAASFVCFEDGPLVEEVRKRGLLADVLAPSEVVRGVHRQTVLQLSEIVHGATSLIPFVYRLSRYIERTSPDLVYLNSQRAGILGSLAARLVGCKCVWHVRDMIDRAYLGPLQLVVVRSALRVLPGSVITNSNFTASLVPRESRVLPSPIASSFFRTAAPRQVGPVTRVGVLGRIADWKGQDLFLRAFSRVFSSSDVRAVLIGAPLFGDQDYLSFLEEMVERLGIAKQVEWRGFRHDVVAELNRLDILVHSSILPEPYGQSIVQGMAVGLPVVAAKSGGPTEIISDGIDGLLYEMGSEEDLAVKLAILRDNRELRSKLSVAARRRAADYSSETVVPYFEDLILELIQAT